uniref:Tubulin/FtsZ GTPase domain-containing protein n=1 Tax=Strigamia maritima TaxID=126957 RepID=T1IQF1_STRMM
MSQSIIIQVGQCGNQIGCCFWDLVLREHAAINKDANFDEALNSFFCNVDCKGKNIKLGKERNKIVNLKARCVLVDMEEGVINQLLKGSTADVFDCKQLLTSQSGSGNNWAVGYKFYGNKYKDNLRELIRKAVEKCDYLQTFFIILSMGGGTGSGIGTFLLSMLADDYPDVYRFVIPVFPSCDDDVITSPYNSVLAMHPLTQFADCVFPVDNEALLEICNRIASATDKLKSCSGSTSVRSSIADSSRLHKIKPFDQMNNIVANLMLNLTSSSRFQGSLNVDLNEITTNLVPFPRLHYITSSLAPIYGLMDVGIPLRTIDNTFTEAFSRNSRLLSFDPDVGTYLASAVLLRGNICYSDLRRNIDKIKSKLRFASWNQEAWKVGLCSVPPVGHPYSVLTLSNNTNFASILKDLQLRFDLLYKKRAHLHHYLNVDGMTVDDFDASMSSLTDLIAEYKQVAGSGNVLPQFEVIM